MSVPAPPSPAELRERLATLPHLDDAEIADQAAHAFAFGGVETSHEGRAADDAVLVDLALACMDLTSLDATDGPGRVRRLAERARRPDPADPAAPLPAAVCVWPDLVGEVADRLAGTGISAAAVAGAFPSARSPLAVRVAEVEAAVAAGADEIDLVIDRAALAEDRPEDALRQLVALRRACGSARLKVILETGSLHDADAVQDAAWVALLAGADFLKTSTGKDGPGASPAAVRVLARAVLAYERETGRRVGVKVSGGVRSAEDGVGYLRLVRDVLGADALRPARVRLGASSLLDALVAARAAAVRPAP
jgi:deoxyribose-phosphate aldolase